MHPIQHIVLQYTILEQRNNIIKRNGVFSSNNEGKTKILKSAFLTLTLN